MNSLIAQRAVERIAEEAVYQCKHIDETDADVNGYIRPAQYLLPRGQVHGVLVVPIVFCSQRRQGDDQINKRDGMQYQVFIGRYGKNGRKETK